MFIQQTTEPTTITDTTETIEETESTENIEDTTEQTKTIVASGNCGKDGDNVTWTLDENGLLTISGIGKMEDYYIELFDYKVSPWFSCRENIKKLIVEPNITSIGNMAFYNCTNLMSAELPNGLLDIGNESFCGCVNLTQITIPNSTTSIGKSSFSGCANLTEIIIPNNIAYIDYSTFSGYTSLLSVKLP